jgi:hypothetical protein
MHQQQQQQRRQQHLDIDDRQALNNCSFIPQSVNSDQRCQLTDDCACCNITAVTPTVVHVVPLLSVVFPANTEAKLQARIFTKDLTDEEIDALAAVAVAGRFSLCVVGVGVGRWGVGWGEVVD